MKRDSTDSPKPLTDYRELLDGTPDADLERLVADLDALYASRQAPGRLASSLDRAVRARPTVPGSSTPLRSSLGYWTSRLNVVMARPLSALAAGLAMFLILGAFAMAMARFQEMRQAQQSSTPAAVIAVPSAPQSAPAPKPVPFPGLATWDLLVISDPTNYLVAKYYAELIKADQHVEVTVHDCQIDDMSFRTALDLLREDAPAQQGASCEGKWADLVREAEVIVVHGNPRDSKPADGSWASPESMFLCVDGGFIDKSADPSALAAQQASITRSCAPETFATYKADLGSLFDKIFSLRDGRPVIMRATDMYIPGIAFSDWSRLGLMEVCAACQDNYGAAIHQAAAEHGVPVASSRDALNGTDHRANPTDLGYIGAYGLLPSDKGAQRVAEALRETGYGYAGK